MTRSKTHVILTPLLVVVIAYLYHSKYHAVAGSTTTTVVKIPEPPVARKWNGYAGPAGGAISKSLAHYRSAWDEMLCKSSNQGDLVEQCGGMWAPDLEVVDFGQGIGLAVVGDSHAPGDVIARIPSALVITKDHLTPLTPSSGPDDLTKLVSAIAVEKLKGQHSPLHSLWKVWSSFTLKLS